jgi:hypothetical protein
MATLCHGQQRWMFVNVSNTVEKNNKIRLFFVDTDTANSLPKNQAWIKEFLMDHNRWKSLCPDGKVTIEVARSCMSIVNSKEGDTCQLSLWEANCSTSMMRTRLTINKFFNPPQNTGISEWYPVVPDSVSETILMVLCNENLPWKIKN